MSKYPFQTLIIDPPWPYDRASKNTKLTGYVNQDGNEQYKTLSIEDMKKLPIGDVVESYIFMWIVSPFLKEGIEMLEAWGFKYITTMAWFKNTGLGVGYWFRGSHELILVAKRPTVESVRTGEQSIFQTKRGRHSAKPDNVHRIIEKHFPAPYLEIFGRRLVDGWTVLGNEVAGDGGDIRDVLPKYVGAPGAEAVWPTKPTKPTKPVAIVDTVEETEEAA